MATTQELEHTAPEAQIVGNGVPVVVSRAYASSNVAMADVQALDLARQFDDEAFVASVCGEAVSRWFYSFDIQGKRVEGVSALGAEEFARLRAEQGYPIEYVTYSTKETTRNGKLGIEAIIVVRCIRSRAQGLGVAFYPYQVERKGGVIVDDNFPDRKAIAVAARNAILQLIPQNIILGVLRARTQFMKTNEDRFDVEVKALLSNSAPAERQPEVFRRATPPAASAPASAMPLMRFGPSKGTPLANLETRDLESALKWARDKGKFEDGQAEMAAELESRREAAE